MFNWKHRLPMGVVGGLVLALTLLAACQASPTPTPQSPPTFSPAWGTTPTTGMSANWQAYAKYFKDIHLWRVLTDRPPTREDMATPTDVFTILDRKIGIFIETTPDFKPGWKLTYRLDRRAYQGEGTEVSLASLVTGPGLYDATIDRPQDAGEYVVRVWVEDVLVANVTFEVR